ncbi:helix-turn-helix domain-containing protein [Rhizobium sp. CFBP 8762]|uniref:helix-turn-helix domain-containing protein n=1 Tax=Rhizobium sp. CFBP 8762 TaxID=2775279 RepID=UPI00177DA3FB|nr:helix-turn-helix domain-containing protein [Rhizobium sp. CFBP 8762]MBD8556351.1 helix-turn-helix domain-containing protein [Rhizobium sp. CFBP 8762]
MAHQREQSFIEFAEDLIGPEAIDRLKASFGGREIHIPRPAGLSEDHELVACLGWDTAYKLVREYCLPSIGFKIYVPVGERSPLFVARQNQRDAVEALLRDGKSTPEIASIVGCSERTIWRRKAAMRRDEEALARKAKALSNRIRTLLLSGCSVAEVAAETKAKTILILFHKQNLIKEGKLNAD